MKVSLTPLPWPLPELLGGILIGGASGLLLWLNGRIAGISGILGGLFESHRASCGWRIGFLGGLFLGGLWMADLRPEAFSMEDLDESPVRLGIGLMLMGLGVGLANGCTSGHGICGLARKSWRSLVATLLFMSVAMLTATLAHLTQ